MKLKTGIPPLGKRVLIKTVHCWFTGRYEWESWIADWQDGDLPIYKDHVVGWCSFETLDESVEND